MPHIPTSPGAFLSPLNTKKRNKGKKKGLKKALAAPSSKAAGRLATRKRVLTGLLG